MSISCNQCGKTVDGEGMAFCPYCGAKLIKTEYIPDHTDEAAQKWISKALAVNSYPERKKILQKGMEACPGNREIEWEMLFVGEEPPKKRGGFMDFSIIKCWILEIYLKPGDFSDERKDRMRAQFFDDPQLIRCLNRFENPEAKQREYLLRLCREYVALFLEGNSQVMGNIFGIHIFRNKEKRLAVPVADMIGRIRADEKLSPDQREQLWKALYQGYAVRMEGNTENLDELLKQE